MAPDAFVGKVTNAVAGLATRSLKSNEQVVAVLKRLGYEDLENTFESVYVHALASRRLDDVPGPVLTLFKDRLVVAAFRRAWLHDDIDIFDEEVRWVFQEFRSGQAVQGLGVDVEEEVRAFYKTLKETAARASTPQETRSGQMLVEILEAVVKKPTPMVPVIPTEAQRFRRDLPEWLEACGYVIDEKASPLEDERTFDMIVSRPQQLGQRSSRLLIRGLDGVADAGRFDQLPDPKRRGVHQSWLVASVQATSGARDAADKGLEERFVYTFDNLIDAQVSFAEYEKSLAGEIKRRSLSDHYVPLAYHRPNSQRQTSGPLPSDDLEEYFASWLEEPVREHISILGEFGMGKTWFTLRLAHNRLAAYHQARAARRPRGRYPLLIQLRDYAKAVSAESLLSEFFFNRFQVGLPSMKAFDVLNRMGRFLLIFDGFDEMARKVDYQKVVDNFWEMAKVVQPGAKAVLTCRDEHFRYAQEARGVFAGEEMAAASAIVLVPPRFDVVHIEPFDEPRVRQAIENRLGSAPSTRKTADLILSHPALANLVKRPVMIEMVLDSLADIVGRPSLVTSQIYLFATDRQMRKNITEERTFTSMTDKVLFLSELAWEMHKSESLSINYKLFPDRIKDIFGEKVEEAQMDHWHYDLMGQTLLVRDEHGNYSFAHRGLVEYFAAYKLLAQADALAPEFIERYRDEEGGRSPAEELRRRASDGPFDSWGAAPFHPNLIEFLAEMAAGKEPLMGLVDWTKGKSDDQVGCVGGNAATVLVRIDPAAFEEADLRGASLRRARLPGVRLRGVNAKGADLRDADLMASDLTGANLQAAQLGGARLAGLPCPATLATDPSGELLFGGPLSGGWVYDVRTRRFLDNYGTAGLAWACDRAVSADAKWLLHAASEWLRVGQVDREAGVVLWDFVDVPTSLGSLPGVAWHPEGWFLVVDREGGVLRVDPGPPGAVSKLDALPFEIPGRPGVAVSPPLWIIGGEDETVVWHERQQRVVATLPAGARAGERPQCSPAGERLSTANKEGLSIFETTHWKPAGHVKGYSQYRTHGWSPTDDRLAFCAQGEVQVVDSADLSIRSRLKPPETPYGVAFHGPDELLVVDRWGTIHLYDLKSEQLIHSAPQVPLCEGADLRGATGLDDATRAALKEAGARV